MLFNIIYFGIAGGLLAVWAPTLGRKSIRFIVGAAVGIVAIVLLPQIRF